MFFCVCECVVVELVECMLIMQWVFFVEVGLIQFFGFVEIFIIKCCLDGVMVIFFGGIFGWKYFFFGFGFFYQDVFEFLLFFFLFLM